MKACLRLVTVACLAMVVVYAQAPASGETGYPGQSARRAAGGRGAADISSIMSAFGGSSGGAGGGRGRMGMRGGMGGMGLLSGMGLGRRGMMNPLLLGMDISSIAEMQLASRMCSSMGQGMYMMMMCMNQMMN